MTEFPGIRLLVVRDRAALVALYTGAADAAAILDATCFYLTRACISALEKGDPAAA